MIDYDDWKLEEQPLEKENKCGWCGEPCEYNFCDEKCSKYYWSDMED